MDAILSGIEKSSIITVGGRPSMGKTSFINSIMVNLLKQKKKCLYFSLEANTLNIIRRLISSMTDIESKKLYIDIEKLKEQDKKEIINAFLKIAQFDLTIYSTDDGYIDVEKIKEKMEEIKPDYVFIDYLQLIRKPNVELISEVLNEFMYEIKKLAHDNNCIIFITSQLSRALEKKQNKIPLLSDIRDCPSVEDISDVVLFVYRDEYYNFKIEEDYLYNKGKAQIIIAKNKYGEVGTIGLLFNNKTMKFSNPIQTNIF